MKPSIRRFFLEIIILKQSNVLHISDTYKPGSSAKYFELIFFPKLEESERFSHTLVPCLLHRYHHTRVVQHAYRQSRPCIESQRTETRRNIRKRNIIVAHVTRCGQHTHTYTDADSAAKSWSYTLDRSGHRDE